MVRPFWREEGLSLMTNLAKNKRLYMSRQFFKSIQTLLLLILVVSSLPVNAQSRGIALQAADQVFTPFSSGIFRALVIGNNQYVDPHNQWPVLETAVSDARAVASVLTEEYGFGDVVLLENATRREILKALEQLSKNALSEDSVLVYYAGHGFLDEESNRGFWVPVDAEGTDNTTFLRNSTIRDELTTIASRARHTLLVSDSCFSGTLLRRGTRGLTQVNKNQSYFKKVARKKSVQILTAGGVEYVDDNYQQSGHSPFTYFFLNELKNNEEPLLTVSELSGSVSQAVANNADQVPESGVLHGAGDELGEFIFIKLKVNVEGIEASKVKVDVEVSPNAANVSVKEISIEQVDQDTGEGDSPPVLILPVPTL